MAPEMPESGTEKGVEPRELSLTESGDTHVPLLSADPEKAKEEDTEDEKSRELRLNEDIRVRPNLVSNLCYAFAFFLGLCIAMFIFARDPHMGSTLAEKTPGFLHAAAHEVQRRSSWMVRQGKKLMGVQKPFLWMVWAEESSLESEEFLRRCVDRWHSSLSSDFEVHLVEAKHFDLWLNSSALPQNFGDLPPKVQEDILKVALLAHFGGVLVDVDSIPIQQDSMMQIWTSLQHSDAQALGTYSYHQECQWSLGMWFLAAKKGSAFMKHWLKLLLEEIGASAGHGLAVAISSRGGPDQGRSFSHPPRQIPLCLRPGDGRFPEKGEKGGGSRPDGAETFQKELRKDSDTLHQFIVNDSKVIAKESRVIAGATENAAHALRLGGTTMSTTTTTTTTTTSTTTSTLPDPVFVTLQTKGSSLLQKVGGPFEVVNIGAGKPWHGYKTKFERLLPFLKSKKDDDLVAFMDGTDIFWGGCEMKDFLHYYQQIVEASGASIVISAEIACGEQPCNKVPPAPEWAVNLANISLNDGFWQKYVSPKGCGSVGCPCASPPAIKFLNSGFIIGPVKDLLPMISWSLDNYDKESTLGDQSVLAKYWFANTDQIALDYQGALCLSTSDLNPYTLFAKDPITGGLWNKAFGRMQCLTHGNGRGRYALWDLLGRFSLGKHGERYAKALKFKKL